MAKFDVRKFARLGAEHRVQQIRDEIAEIVRQFPDLDAPRRETRTAFPPNELAALGGTEPARSRRRRRWKMTAAQKQAVGLRMKKYWAARKAAAGKKR